MSGSYTKKKKKKKKKGGGGRGEKAQVLAISYKKSNKQ